MPRATLVLAPLLMILIVGVVLSLERGHVSSPLVGTWEAKGFVTQADGATNEPVGMELSREWKLEERCDMRSCRLWLTREAAGGRTESAPLYHVNGALHAVFRLPTVGCGAPGTITRSFDIRAAPGAGQLTAEEGVVNEFPGCADGGPNRGSNTLRWIARRA